MANTQQPSNVRTRSEASRVPSPSRSHPSSVDVGTASQKKNVSGFISLSYLVGFHGGYILGGQHNWEGASCLEAMITRNKFLWLIHVKYADIYCSCWYDSININFLIVLNVYDVPLFIWYTLSFFIIVFINTSIRVSFSYLKKLKLWSLGLWRFGCGSEAPWSLGF